MPALPRAGRARLHYVEREDPGDGRPRNRGTAIIMPLPDFVMRSPALPYHAYATLASPVVRTPRPRTVTTISARLASYRLTTSSYAGVALLTEGRLWMIMAYVRDAASCPGLRVVRCP